MAKISNAESVDYDGIIVQGDLDLANLWEGLHEGRLLGSFSVIISTIRITNSQVDGSIKLENAIFAGWRASISSGPA